ncbi:MAG: hypothetical protein ACYSWU_15185 [Planctomycetota bacterium]|jgi:hypothetical protein
MKQVATFMILVLLAISIGVAQDPAAVKRTAAEQPKVSENAATDDAPQTVPLDELEWMVGQWVDEGEASKVITSCSWTKNRKFLTRSFSVTIDGKVSLEGTQFVGWDPIAKRIRSWTFDSEGGFGEGRWIKDGNRWLVKMSFVLASGERASALNVITYVDQDTLRWQSIDREIAGELQPNIPEVTVVREKAKETGSEQGEKEVSK